MFFSSAFYYTLVMATGKLGKCAVFSLMDDLSYLIWSPSKLTEKFGVTHTFALWKHLQE